MNSICCCATNTVIVNALRKGFCIEFIFSAPQRREKINDTKSMAKGHRRYITDCARQSVLGLEAQD